MIPQNLGLIFQQTAHRFPDKTAFLYKEVGRYESLSWRDFSSRVEILVAYFISRGVKAGDSIAILSENRVEWALLDIAAQCMGVSTVPIYTSLTPAEIQYILSDSGAVMLGVSSTTLLEKVLCVQDAIPMVREILAFDAAAVVDMEKSKIPITLLKTAEKTAVIPGELSKRIAAVSSDSIASIIYTSGTTGIPKGVLLTHSNFIHNVIFCKDAFRMNEEETHLSFLPLSHVFERTAGFYLMLYLGASIAYAESMDTVPQNLSEVKPTFLLGVPRFYEKTKDRVSAAVKSASFLRQSLFYWAQAQGAQRRKAIFEKKGISFGLRARLAVAQALVYKKFKSRLGGRVRFCVSGGAALPAEIAEFFYDLGVMIYEGYGLTETSPVISANREGRFRFGTVGIPLEGVQVTISPEGEILTKGPCVMKGYFHKKEETTAVLQDGWFHTGDLGRIDKDGFLVITGRKKELIVTSGGKKVAPQPIEAAIERDPFFLRCVLYGEGKKYITAFLVPQQVKILEYAGEQKMAFSSYAELLSSPQIYSMLESRIEMLTKDFASFEKIKHFALLDNDFTQQSGELTPTLKVKREVVSSRYKHLLLPFYEKDK